MFKCLSIWFRCSALIFRSLSTSHLWTLWTLPSPSSPKTIRLWLLISVLSFAGLCWRNCVIAFRFTGKSMSLFWAKLTHMADGFYLLVPSCHDFGLCVSQLTQGICKWSCCLGPPGHQGHPINSWILGIDLQFLDLLIDIMKCNLSFVLELSLLTNTTSLIPDWF